MQTPVQDTDYLVIGTGAVAMAFVDTLLDESPDATVAMVDRHHRPGGHWNHAYPFVRLHQPAEWYGVASIELGSGRCDAVGPNAGLYGLSSGAEVLAHFDRAMRERFLPSGRVRWLPMSEHTRGADGVHRVRSQLHGGVSEWRVRRRIVDATQARTEVPSTHPPKYAVAEGVRCVPLNALPAIDRPHACTTVVGSGKTGIDAVLWLLEQGLPPSRIRWVMPRDAWFFDRANIQPGLANFERNMAYVAAQFDAIAEAASVPDLFARLEASGALMRIDAAVEPTTFRCAVVSRGEMELLRAVARDGEIVRLGRVRALEPGRMALDRGALAADPDTLYVDCSASAIQQPVPMPVFDGDTIHLFMVRTCQPTFSAALIAWVESHIDDDARRNAMCRPVPSPEHPIDWLRMWAATLRNTAAWREDAALSAWLMRCRLNGQAVMLRDVPPDDEARMALFRAHGPKAAAAMAKLPTLLAQAA